jgi:hypothetical protein
METLYFSLDLSDKIIWTSLGTSLLQEEIIDLFLDDISDKIYRLQEDLKLASNTEQYSGVN